MAGSCLLVIYWVQAWPQKWPHGGHGAKVCAESDLGESCHISLLLRAECLKAHINVGKCAEYVTRSCLPVERWVALQQRWVLF